MKIGDIIVFTKTLRWNCGTAYAYEGQISEICYDTSRYVTLKKASGKSWDISKEELKENSRIASPSEIESFRTGVNNINKINCYK
jgi:hypothetical protein